MVYYDNKDLNFVLKNKRINNKWLKVVAEKEGKKLGDISFLFCSDPHILEVNRQYLNHDFYTDIITFDYCEGDILSGDIVISIDTVKANATHYGVSFEDELDRVMVHGVLHLIGYDDATDIQVAEMRRKESEYIALKKTFLS